MSAAVVDFPNATLPARFLAAFTPAPHIYGVYATTAEPQPGKKLKGRAETVTGAVTRELIAEHLAGNVRLGFAPLHKDGRCWFGAIDIDKYDGLDLKALAGKVARLKLPLIVCNTKSGGAHLYAFFSESRPAAEVQWQLAEWAAAVWTGRVEIFPKQTTLDDVTAKGNWINAPYYGSSTYAVTAQGERLSCEEFLTAVEVTRKGADRPVEAVGGAGEFDLEEAASILLPHWTSDRHLLALTVSGALLRTGVTEENVQALIARVTEEAHDEEPDERQRCVEIAVQAIERGAPMFGIPALRERMGEDTERFLAACGCGKDEERLQAMNAEYAIIRWHGRTLVLTQPIDPTTGWREVVLSGLGDFKAWMQNKGWVGRKQVANWWLDHARRREYQGVVFEPGRERPGYLNLWGGWGCEAAPGDCQRWLDMVRDVIAAGNEEHYRYILAWCADAVQNQRDPAERPGVALVLRGKQGTGKGMFARELGALFGEHFLHIRHSAHLVGKFNAHLVRALLVFADEAIFAGDKKDLGALKGLITEPTMPIEYKGKDVVKVANHVRAVMATNERWAVPAEAQDRRFAVFDVSDAHIQDEKYFRPVAEQMRNGGRSALLHHLLHYDGTGIDLRKIPDTQARRDQQTHSMDAFQDFWRGRLADPDGWKTEAIVAELMRDYTEMAGSRYHFRRSQFGTETKALFPTMKKVRPRIRGVNPNAASRDLRVPAYLLPELKKARAAFDKHYGPVDWEQEEFTPVDSEIDQEPQPF